MIKLKIRYLLAVAIVGSIPASGVAAAVLSRFG